MAKTNPKAKYLIDEYIAKKEPFLNEICELLRELIHKADTNIIEDWKWSRPIFIIKNKMVCGFSSHKNHVSLTFFNGALISDKHHLFSDDCIAQNTRTIKFTNISEIDKNDLLYYFKEAILLSEIKPKKLQNKTEIEIPKLLKNALAKNKLAKQNFDKMAFTYRKEYVNHIESAKRETTKISRLEKVILNLENNIKMHEQYKC